MNNSTTTATAMPVHTLADARFSYATDWIEMGRNEDGEMNIGDDHYMTAELPNGKIFVMGLGRDTMGYYEDEDGCGGSYIKRFDGEAAYNAAMAVINTSGIDCFENLMGREFTYERAVYGSESHDERELMDDDELARCYF